MLTTFSQDLRRGSLAICLVGAAVGIPAAVAGVRWLRSMLYGLAPRDPATFLVAIAGTM